MVQIFCHLRREWVESLPEEIVRQDLIKKMIFNLGYPSSVLMLEKSLRQMPHLTLSSQKLPDRRADIVCFGRGIHPHFDLYPLLLIECKSVKLSSKVINQVAGYNHYMQSYFIAIANQEEIRTGWFDKEKKEYTFINRLPTYLELMNSIIKISE
jgi:Type I restriction enzyme R protein N terminus (HSDR_N)